MVKLRHGAVVVGLVLGCSHRWDPRAPNPVEHCVPGIADGPSCVEAAQASERLGKSYEALPYYVVGCDLGYAVACNRVDAMTAPSLAACEAGEVAQCGPWASTAPGSHPALAAAIDRACEAGPAACVSLHDQLRRRNHLGADAGAIRLCERDPAACAELSRAPWQERATVLALRRGACRGGVAQSCADLAAMLVWSADPAVVAEGAAADAAACAGGAYMACHYAETRARAEAAMRQLAADCRAHKGMACFELAKSTLLP